MGSDCSIGVNFQFRKLKIVLETDGDDINVSVLFLLRGIRKSG